MNFDLPAYLARIALRAAPAPDVDGLNALQRAHRLAIPFDGLDAVLGRPILIESAPVFAKLVGSRRGGYCFEHNRLLLDALAALGFAARPLLARVWLGIAPDAPPPRTHTLSLVTIDGTPWIADAGFGGSYAPPMPLREGEFGTAPDGARHRLRPDPEFGWMLERMGDPASTDGRGPGAGWMPQYSFTLDPVHSADLQLSNHWTATAPDSRFRQLAVASLVLPNGFASLTDRSYRRRTTSGESAEEIADPRKYRMRLSLLFGIDLTPDEVAGLGLFEPA